MTVRPGDGLCNVLVPYFCNTLWVDISVGNFVIWSFLVRGGRCSQRIVLSHHAAGMRKALKGVYFPKKART